MVGKYKGNGSTKFRTTLEYVLAISHDTEPTYETVTFIVSGSRECITQFLPTYSRVTLITLYIYMEILFPSTTIGKHYRTVITVRTGYWCGRVVRDNAARRYTERRAPALEPYVIYKRIYGRLRANGTDKSAAVPDTRDRNDESVSIRATRTNRRLFNGRRLGWLDEND